MPEPEIAIRKPFPGPLIAFAMTYLAWWAQFAWTIVGQRFAPLQAAMAFAFLMAYGLIGVLALSSVEKPWGPRIGFTAIPARSVPALVLLIPIAFVAVAVQALVRLPLMRGRATGIWEWHGPLLSARSDLGLLGSLVVVVVLIPLLAEWFFRGVLQQGVVGEHGLWGHMTSLYDTLIHVPMTMMGPGVPHGVVTDPVSLLDVMPTVLGYAGIASPAMDGLDLRGVIDGKQSMADRIVRAEHMRTDLATHLWSLNRPPAELRSIRARRAAAIGGFFKRIVAEDGEDDGFNLEEDPGEMNPMPGPATRLFTEVPKPPPPRGPARDLDPAQIDALKSLGYMR